MSEHQIQCAFFEIITYTTLGEYCFAIANGGKRHVLTALKLKREGVKPGVFDVFCSIPSHRYPGFYIEFKMPGKKLTDEQEIFARRMSNAGYLCHVYTDAMEAYQAVKSYSKNEKLDASQWEKHVRKRRVKQQTTT